MEEPSESKISITNIGQNYKEGRGRPWHTQWWRKPFLCKVVKGLEKGVTPSKTSQFEPINILWTILLLFLNLFPFFIFISLFLPQKMGKSIYENCKVTSPLSPLSPFPISLLRFTRFTLHTLEAPFHNSSRSAMGPVAVIKSFLHIIFWSLPRWLYWVTRYKTQEHTIVLFIAWSKSNLTGREHRCFLFFSFSHPVDVNQSR